MHKNKLVVAYEYSTLAKTPYADEIGIPHKAFDCLWKYALSSSDSDADSIMSAKISKGHEVIKLKNYVGTIQTKENAYSKIKRSFPKKAENSKRT